MTVKLILSINEATAKRIKHYAAKNNTSVTKIAEEQFNKPTLKPTRKGQSSVDKYAGTLIHHKPNIDNAREECLKEKHGL